MLRDGSKSGMSIGDSGGPGGRQFHRPGSSASSTGPTETEYMQVDGSSVNQSRYVFHGDCTCMTLSNIDIILFCSPSSTGALGNMNSNEKNRNGAVNDEEKESADVSKTHFEFFL